MRPWLILLMAPRSDLILASLRLKRCTIQESYGKNCFIGMITIISWVLVPLQVVIRMFHHLALRKVMLTVFSMYAMWKATNCFK